MRVPLTGATSAFGGPSPGPEVAGPEPGSPDPGVPESLDGPPTQLSEPVGGDSDATGPDLRRADPDGTQLHDAFADDQDDPPPPPPPPFEDPPERPLFASTERRRNLPPGWPPGGPQSATGSGGSGVPSDVTPVTAGSRSGPATGGGFWPFTGDDEILASGEIRTGKEGRNWIRLAAVVAVCLAIVVAMAFAFRLGREGGQPSAQPTGGSGPARTGVDKQLQVVSATAFDPEGDHAENDSEAANAVDGKPGTVWQTSTYYGNPRLGGLKSGVGLLLDLGTDETVGSLRVHFGSSPTGVEVYAAAAGVNNPPASLNGLQKVGDNPSAGADTVIRLAAGTRTRYLVLWLTKLPPGPGGYRGVVSDVSVWS
jgi:hypothetical protein